MGRRKIGLIATYDSLKDPYLQDYFHRPIVRSHLRRMGLLTRRGEVVPDTEWRKRMERKEKNDYIQRNNTDRIVNESIEFNKLQKAKRRLEKENAELKEAIRRIKGRSTDDSRVELPPINGQTTEQDEKRYREQNKPSFLYTLADEESNARRKENRRDQGNSSRDERKLKRRERDQRLLRATLEKNETERQNQYYKRTIEPLKEEVKVKEEQEEKEKQKPAERESDVYEDEFIKENESAEVAESKQETEIEKRTIDLPSAEDEAEEKPVEQQEQPLVVDDLDDQKETTNETDQQAVAEQTEPIEEEASEKTPTEKAVESSQELADLTETKDAVADDTFADVTTTEDAPVEAAALAASSRRGSSADQEKLAISRKDSPIDLSDEKPASRRPTPVERSTSTASQDDLTASQVLRKKSNRGSRQPTPLQLDNDNQRVVSRRDSQAEPAADGLTTAISRKSSQARLLNEASASRGSLSAQDNTERAASRKASALSFADDKVVVSTSRRASQAESQARLSRAALIDAQENDLLIQNQEEEKPKSASQRLSYAKADEGEESTSNRQLTPLVLEQDRASRRASQSNLTTEDKPVSSRRVSELRESSGRLSTPIQTEGERAPSRHTPVIMDQEPRAPSRSSLAAKLLNNSESNIRNLTPTRFDPIKLASSRSATPRVDAEKQPSRRPSAVQTNETELASLVEKPATEEETPKEEATQQPKEDEEVTKYLDEPSLNEEAQQQDEKATSEQAQESGDTIEQAAESNEQVSEQQVADSTQQAQEEAVSIEQAAESNEAQQRAADLTDQTTESNEQAQEDSTAVGEQVANSTEQIDADTIGQAQAPSVVEASVVENANESADLESNEPIVDNNQAANEEKEQKETTTNETREAVQNLSNENQEQVSSGTQISNEQVLASSPSSSNINVVEQTNKIDNGSNDQTAENKLTSEGIQENKPAEILTDGN